MVEKKFSQKYPLIFSFLFTLTFILITNFSIFVITLMLEYFNIIKLNLLSLIEDVVSFLTIILTLVLFKCSKILKSDFKSFKKAFKGTIFIFILVFGWLFLAIVSVIETKQEVVGFLKIIIGIFQIFSAAFIEEILFRGILANFLAFKYAQTKKGTYWSIFLSNLIFAMVHFFNVRTGAKISAVSFQVINAFFIGSLVTIVYFKFNHNIFVVSLWHTVLNCNGLFDVYFLKKSISFADTFNRENVIETLGYRICLIIILILICLFYLRKNAVEKIIENVNSFKKEFYNV